MLNFYTVRLFILDSQEKSGLRRDLEIACLVIASSSAKKLDQWYTGGWTITYRTLELDFWQKQSIARVNEPNL